MTWDNQQQHIYKQTQWLCFIPNYKFVAFQFGIAHINHNQMTWSWSLCESLRAFEKSWETINFASVQINLEIKEQFGVRYVGVQ
jgi:hypothetical protein